MVRPGLFGVIPGCEAEPRREVLRRGPSRHIVATLGDEAEHRVRPQAVHQLKILAGRVEKSERELIAEALNTIFEKYGENQVA